MIARLRGELAESALTEIVVDVNGVGYNVSIPLSTFDRLPRPGNKVELLISTQVREDSISLYGFNTAEEKGLFELLLSVSGIGSRLALNILSAMPVKSFCTAIANADVKSIGRINGLGKKTAERTVLELKNKIDKISPESSVLSSEYDTASKVAEEAILALTQLGFKHESASKSIHGIIKELDPSECSSENLIRLTLQKLNG